MNSTIFKKAGRWVVHNLPTIMQVAGTVGVVGTAIFAGNDTLKAKSVYDSYHQLDEDGKTSVRTVIKTAECYIPTIICGTITLACFWTAHGMLITRLDKIGIAYNRLAKSYSNFRAELGPEGGAVVGAIAADALPEGASDELKEDKDLGDDSYHWFYLDCPQVDRHWFKSTWKEVMTASAHANDEYSYSGWCSLKKYLSELGYSDDEINHIPNELGWDMSYLYEDFECPFIQFEYGEVDLGNGLKGNGIYFPIEASICYDYAY